MNVQPRQLLAPDFRVKVEGRPLEPRQARSVSELIVTRELGTSDRFSLTLANPYPDLPWTHGQDAALFKPGGSVTIDMGYVNNRQPMFSGEVTALTANFPETGTSTLTVEGHSRLHRLEGARQTRTFQDSTDSEIVEAIAAQVKLTAQADRTTVKYPYVLQCNQTNLEFLRARAAAIDFELLVDNRTLIFRKSKAGSAKVESLKWGETLRSFRPTVDSLAPVTDVMVRGYDLNTKEAIVGRAGTGAEETTMGTQTGAKLVSDAFGSRLEVVVDREPSSQAEAEQHAKAIYNRRMMGLITGTGTCVGQPTLRAGTVIALDGLGSRFNGPYYVVSATHAIGNSGYQTRFSVKRNAV
jgi:phage protein D